MSYYATGGGDIVFTRPLTDAEFKEICKTLAFVFEYDGEASDRTSSHQGKGYFNVWNRDPSYHEEEVFEALDKVAEIVPVESGNIIYSGEDYDAVWRFIYRDGKGWFEDNGCVVFDDDVFGELSWCRDDIRTVLTDEGIEANDTLVDRIFSECKSRKHFTEAMEEAGWASLRKVVSEMMKEVRS